MAAEVEERLKTQVFEVYIRAPAEAIWDALTTPEWTARYGYRAPQHFDLRPGGTYRAMANEGMLKFGLPATIIDGEIIEALPPKKLVQTYRWLFTPEQKAEGFTRVTYEIEPTGMGFCRVGVTHEVGNAPSMAGMIGSRFSKQGSGGWTWILNDLKTLLETGKTMSD
jgi:uncharacterized protein YndB with AHSA1/START domain